MCGGGTPACGVRACRSSLPATVTSSVGVLGRPTLSAAVCVCGGERWRRAPDPLGARARARADTGGPGVDRVVSSLSFTHRFKRRVRSSKTVRNYDRLVALGPAGAPPRTPGDNTGDRSDRPHTARTVTPTTYRRARCTAPPRRSHFPSRTSTTSSKSPQTFTRWTRCSRSWKKNPRLESQP